MGKLKKLVATACFITMALGAVAPAEASLREQDIVWIGSHNGNSSNFSGVRGGVESAHGKNIVYWSSANKRYQIYFGSTAEKSGFRYEDVTALADGKLYYVTTNRTSYNGMIIDEEGNEVYSGLKNIADEVRASYHDGVVFKGLEKDRYICGETKEGLVILDTENDCKIINTYKGYEFDPYMEIYQNKLDNKRHIRIIDKVKDKLGFLWLSQKSGASEILAKNLYKNDELVINKAGEYKIIYASGDGDRAKIINTRGKVLWSGKGKEIGNVAGNRLEARIYGFNPGSYPYKGASKEVAGTHILITIFDRNTSKYGVIRDDGKMMLGYKYNGILKTYKNMAIVEDKGDKQYLVNYKGRTLTSKKYDKIFTFHNGKAVVKIDGKYGIISETGKELVKPIYSKLVATKIDLENSFNAYEVGVTKNKDISDGMIVKKGGDYIYINKAGKEKVLEETYDNIKKLSNIKYQVSSLLITMFDGKYGIMAADGKELYKPKYEFFRILNMAEGVFSLGIKKYGKTGGYVEEIIIDKYGKKLLSFNHLKTIKRVPAGEYIVVKDKSASKDKKTEKVMLYNAQWGKITEFKNKWDKIVDYRDGLFSVMDKDRNMGVVDISGKEILPVKYSKLEFDGDFIILGEKYDKVEEIGFLVR